MLLYHINVMLLQLYLVTAVCGPGMFNDKVIALRRPWSLTDPQTYRYHEFSTKEIMYAGVS